MFYTRLEMTSDDKCLMDWRVKKMLKKIQNTELRKAVEMKLSPDQRMASMHVRTFFWFKSMPYYKNWCEKHHFEDIIPFMEKKVLNGEEHILVLANCILCVSDTSRYCFYESIYDKKISFMKRDRYYVMMVPCILDRVEAELKRREQALTDDMPDIKKKRAILAGQMEWVKDTKEVLLQHRLACRDYEERRYKKRRITYSQMENDFEETAFGRQESESPMEKIRRDRDENIREYCERESMIQDTFWALQ